ncbi:MAG TPA: FHA domain-containing protein [Dyella sp.]|nr:FHA domain-containing protein [Dyella sp.]
MRIEFPHAAREDIPWDAPVLTVGSAPDNTVVLGTHQAAPHQLELRRDERGCTLRILPGAGRTYLNARPVRERAIVRAGDVLSVGDCRMLIREDHDPGTREPLHVPEAGRCTVALRAVAGPLSGRVLPLRDRLELGPSTTPALELPQGESAAISLCWSDGQLRLRQEQRSDRHPLRVNGVAAGELALQPGDQIGLATHRFVVDAPGMQPEPELAALAVEDPLPEEQAGPRGEVWWLIVTAAVLALGIALVLLVRL